MVKMQQSGGLLPATARRSRSLIKRISSSPPTRNTTLWGGIFVGIVFTQRRFSYLPSYFEGAKPVCFLKSLEKS